MFFIIMKVLFKFLKYGFKYLKIVFLVLRDVFLPKVCLRCDKLSENILCDECVKSKSYCKAKRFCRKCGKNGAFEHGFCNECYGQKRNYRLLRTIVRYNEITKDLIHLFKYDQRLDCADYIINDIITNFPYKRISFDYITCVPNHYFSFVKKGYHHTEYLAHGIEKKLNIPFKYFVKRVGFAYSQTHMSINKRAKNIENTFKLTLNENLKDKNILLVEDVITTGSTINEICKVLSKTSANIYVLSYADARNIEEF